MVARIVSDRKVSLVIMGHAFSLSLEIVPFASEGRLAVCGGLLHPRRMNALVSDSVPSPLASPIRPPAVAAAEQRAAGAGIGRRASGCAMCPPCPWAARGAGPRPRRPRWATASGGMGRAASSKGRGRRIGAPPKARTPAAPVAQRRLLAVRVPHPPVGGCGDGRRGGGRGNRRPYA